MTVKEFWDSKEYLAIHCSTEEQAILLTKKFDELGRHWVNGESYLTNTYWNFNYERTCYTNCGNHYGRDYLNPNNPDDPRTIEFEDLEDFKF